MPLRSLRLAFVMTAGLVWLPGCESVPMTGFSATISEVEASPPEPPGPALALRDAFDDLDLGKRHFREENFGLAEVHFRRAVEKGGGPVERQAEAWLGLAASYDKLRRFELADRAYKQAIRLIGPTPSILNNQGYSYLMRGDFARARKALLSARAKDPDNPYILNNIAMLDESVPQRR